MEKNHILQILWGADPVVKLTLIILLSFSVASWAIIVYKQRELKKLRSASHRFFDSFWRLQSVEELLAKYSGDQSPLFNIFRRTVGDLIRKPKAGEPRRAVTAESIRQQIDRAKEDEIERIERYIPFLATTGS